MNVVASLNNATPHVAAQALKRCCGAQRWVEALVANRPYENMQALLEAAQRHWGAMTRDDILEAFDHHPRIGDNITALREKFARTIDWSVQEQASVAHASEDTLVALRDGNRLYEQTFGHIFIVCASGQSAAQMLAALTQRLNNAPEQELKIAAAEQAKITALRLEKLEL